MYELPEGGESQINEVLWKNLKNSSRDSILLKGCSRMGFLRRRGRISFLSERRESFFILVGCKLTKILYHCFYWFKKKFSVVLQEMFFSSQPPGERGRKF